jgi:hypothetical protein
VSDEDDEYWETWERSLANHGYESLIPVREYFSRDLTEAWMMINFWIKDGVIRKKEILEDD